MENNLNLKTCNDAISQTDESAMNCICLQTNEIHICYYNFSEKLGNIFGDCEKITAEKIEEESKAIEEFSTAMKRILK